MRKTRKYLYLGLVFFIFCISFNINVFAAKKVPLKITKQPRNVTAKYCGEKVEFTICAKGDNISYKWQKKKNGSNKWVTLKDHDEWCEVKANWSNHNSKFRCIVKNKKTKETVTSKVATLKVKTKPKIKSQPENVFTRKSGVAEFDLKAYGNGIIYKWYESSDNGKSWNKIGYNSPHLSVEAYERHNGRIYRCLLTNRYTKKKTWSKTVKITITDINARYHYQIEDVKTKGLLRPKAADTYIYVSAYNSIFVKYIKEALSILNKIVPNTFVYTNSKHIADIIFMDFENDVPTSYNIYTIENTKELLDENASKWRGVAFSTDEKSEHFMIALNRTYLRYEKDCIKVMTCIHEMGHCIGIGHNEQEDSVMGSCSEVESMSTNDFAVFRKQILKVKNM